MAMKLQGLASKMAKLKHDLEAEADRLHSRIEDTAEKSAGTFAEAHKIIDSTKRDLADVDAFNASMQEATNGGPPLEDEPASTPIPTVRGYPA